jgi:hypothetical protein
MDLWNTVGWIVLWLVVSLAAIVLGVVWYRSQRWIVPRRCRVKGCRRRLTYKEYQERTCPDHGWFGGSNGG